MALFTGDVKSDWVIFEGDWTPRLIVDQPLVNTGESYADVSSEYDIQPNECVARIMHVQAAYFVTAASNHPGCVLAGPAEEL